MNDHTSTIYGIVRTAPKSTLNRRKEGRSPSARQPHLFLKISAIALAAIVATALITALSDR